MTTPAPQFEVIHAASSELIEQCKKIRIEVFVDEQKFSLDCEVDSHDDDPATTHLLLRETSTMLPVGTLRFHPLVPHPDLPERPSPARSDGRVISYQLGRVCILEPYRKFKLGATLLQAAHSILKRIVVDGSSEAGDSTQEATIEIELHSQMHAMGFYARSGYEPFGSPFIEDGQPHMMMRIALRP